MENKFKNLIAVNDENYDIFRSEILNKKLVEISKEIIKDFENFWENIEIEDEEVHDFINEIREKIQNIFEFYPISDESEILYTNSLILEQDLSENTLEALKEIKENTNLFFKKIEIQDENIKNFYHLILNLFANWTKNDDIYKILFEAKDSYFEKDWLKFNWHFWLEEDELEGIFKIIKEEKNIKLVFLFLSEIFLRNFIDEFELNENDILDYEFEIKEEAIFFLKNLKLDSFNVSKDIFDEKIINLSEKISFEKEKNNFIEEFSKFYDVYSMDFNYSQVKIDKNNSEISFLEAIYKNLENFSDKEILFKNLKKDFFEIWEKYGISKNKSKVELKKFRNFFENLDFENQDFESKNFQKIIDLAISFLLLFEYNESMFDWWYDFDLKENKNFLANEIIKILEKMWFARKIETFKNLINIDFFDRFYKLKLNFIEI